MQDLLDKAQNYCVENGHRYTEPRARVLKILLSEAKPLGAYEVLKKLSKEISNPKPPTVYRAIQFWYNQGFIHCIDSLKSYVACLHGHHVGQTQFLVCNQCDFVKELESQMDFTPTTKSADLIQFAITNCTVELKGLCANCRATS